MKKILLTNVTMTNSVEIATEKEAQDLKNMLSNYGIQLEVKIEEF